MQCIAPPSGSDVHLDLTRLRRLRGRVVTSVHVSHIRGARLLRLVRIVHAGSALPEPHPPGSAADGAVERDFAAAHLEAVAGVDGLDVEDLAPREPEHALDRRGDVLVHPVGELDHDDRAFPRCTNEPANDCARSPAELAEHNLHNSNASTQISAEHKLHKQHLSQLGPTLAQGVRLHRSGPDLRAADGEPEGPAPRAESFHESIAAAACTMILHTFLPPDRHSGPCATVIAGSW